MIEHTTQLRVRYGETDKMGVVYYGNYTLYFEVGRAEWLRSIGLTYREMEDWGLVMPVTDVQIKYLRPARYDELLTLKTSVRELPGKRITFHTEIFDEAGELITIGKVSLAFLDGNTMQQCPPPKAIMELMGPQFNRP